VRGLLQYAQEIFILLTLPLSFGLSHQKAILSIGVATTTFRIIQSTNWHVHLLDTIDSKGVISAVALLSYQSPL